MSNLKETSFFVAGPRSLTTIASRVVRSVFPEYNLPDAMSDVAAPFARHGARHIRIPAMRRRRSTPPRSLLEGDGTSDPALLPAMQDRLAAHDVDVVIASRQVEGGSYRNFPFKRLLFSLAAKGILAASGSSCADKALKSSHVLDAIGLDHALANASILFSLGFENTESDVDKVIEVLPSLIARLRSMSPLWNG